MNKPLIFTSVLMSAALVAGAATTGFSRKQRLSNTGERSDREIRCGQSAARLPQIRKTCAG